MSLLLEENMQNLIRKKVNFELILIGKKIKNDIEKKELIIFGYHLKCKN